MTSNWRLTPHAGPASLGAAAVGCIALWPSSGVAVAAAAPPLNGSQAFLKASSVAEILFPEPRLGCKSMMECFKSMMERSDAGRTGGLGARGVSTGSSRPTMSFSMMLSGATSVSAARLLERANALPAFAFAFGSGCPVGHCHPVAVGTVLCAGTLLGDDGSSPSDDKLPFATTGAGAATGAAIGTAADAANGAAPAMSRASLAMTPAGPLAAEAPAAPLPTAASMATSSRLFSSGMWRRTH
mmetsp:Transcript_115022/g.210598  ORF Transcript_115022/g.210598 Transcript_115022/m.210598 type:complete len:242 (-) Transcript_115022:519-1244(-)